MHRKVASISRMCTVTSCGYTFNMINVFGRGIMLHGLSEVNVPFFLQLCVPLQSSADSLCGNYNVHFLTCSFP
jgi:hypothetical protein